jgi:hypothetical protein
MSFFLHEIFYLMKINFTCPYGLQMEKHTNLMIEVLGTFDKLFDINIFFWFMSISFVVQNFIQKYHSQPHFKDILLIFHPKGHTKC